MQFAPFSLSILPCRFPMPQANLPDPPGRCQSLRHRNREQAAAQLGYPGKRRSSNYRFPLGSIALYFLYQFVTSGMEEPGWRGFGLEVLRKNMSAEKKGRLDSREHHDNESRDRIVPAAVTWLLAFIILKLYGGSTLTREGKSRSAGLQG